MINKKYFERFNDLIIMPPFLSKKSKIKIKIFAWYQIIGGIFGILLTFWELARTDQISGLILIIFMVAFALYSFSIYCGRLLLTDNYSKGLRLSIINQSLQIFSFSMLGYAFTYVAGMMLVGEIKSGDGLNLGFNFSITSTWQISINSEEKPFLLAINIVAIYLVYFTHKLRITIKNEKIAYDEQQLVEVSPALLIE